VAADAAGQEMTRRVAEYLCQLGALALCFFFNQLHRTFSLSLTSVHTDAASKAQHAATQAAVARAQEGVEALRADVGAPTDLIIY
jgi:hypothetical protein